MRLNDDRQAGFTIPITMLLVSVLMVLSTAIVAMTVASFRDAAKTRNRVEILNAAEVGLQMAIAEIMPGLNLVPNFYYSWATASATPDPPPHPNAYLFNMTTAQSASPTNGDDAMHEFQLFANVRNWPAFADWNQWPGGAYPTNPATLHRGWAKGWWPVPRNMEYDDAYFNEDASTAAGAKAYPTSAVAKREGGSWLVNNPATGSSRLAFPVRVGTDSEPVRNLYWYWLTETATNTPTNTQLRDNFRLHNGNEDFPFHVNSPPIRGTALAERTRDVGIGAWWNHLEYADGADLAGFVGEPSSDPTKPAVTFTPRADRYNFLNTPVLKKIYTVDHRGAKIRVAVYCRMILREYFHDETGNIPANLLAHMRRQTSAGGPNAIFYLVAVQESSAMQRGTRVQQAIYVPVGPATPQDVEATLGRFDVATNPGGFGDMDGRMMPATMHLVLDKHLLAGKDITGKILPASGDLSYRIPVPGPAYTAQNGAPPLVMPPGYSNRSPRWVYLIEWNGLTDPAPHGAGALYNHERVGAIHSTNSALIMQVPGSNPPRWVRSPLRVPADSVMELDHFPGATPSAYANTDGSFTIGTNTDTGLPPPPPTGPLTELTRWDGPGVHLWGGQTNAASMSYFTVTELQIARPWRNPPLVDGSPELPLILTRFSRTYTATRSAHLDVGATPPPAVP